MLKVSPLFSGSKGNCTLIQSPQANILLDAGYSYRSIVAALAQRGLKPNDVTAIVVTHEHTDHIGAIPMWTRHTSTPLYVPELLVDVIEQRTYSGDVHGISDSFVLGDVEIQHYECFHDAVSCFGYKFVCGDSKFACVTDTGHPDAALVNFLKDSRAIMLESNHDEDMLKRGEYSYALKQRILSPYGHLSNFQAAEVLRQLANSSVKTVILAHLSENNNNKEIAFNTAVEAYASCGKVEGKDVCIYVADQRKNEVTVCLD